MNSSVKEWNEITVMLDMTKDAAIRQPSTKGYVHECTYHMDENR